MCNTAATAPLVPRSHPLPKATLYSTGCFPIFQNVLEQEILLAHRFLFIKEKIVLLRTAVGGGKKVPLIRLHNYR
uniref:Uncharacterized protein n=1 Tax=Oryza brachyantha TaxID=4533 RepID=J3L5Y8_ORYBR